MPFFFSNLSWSAKLRVSIISFSLQSESLSRCFIVGSILNKDFMDSDLSLQWYCSLKNDSPLFSLMQEAQRKKLSKKEMPLSLRRCSVSHYTALREISPLRRRPIPHRRSSGLSSYALRFRALDVRRLLRKAGENLSEDIAVAKLE